MSYSDELNDFLDEQEQQNRKAVVKDFIELGRAVGVDVPAEILDNHKSAQEVLDLIGRKAKC